MALAVLAQQIAQTEGLQYISIDAAGTHAMTRAHTPDPGAIATLLCRSYSAPPRRTRGVVAQDFLRFDLELAMDQHNLKDLQARCPPAHCHKVQLFLQHATNTLEQEIPDPYYVAPAGFEQLLPLCEMATRGLVAHLRS
jgi:protein-tyrosine phosphatase